LSLLAALGGLTAAVGVSSALGWMALRRSTRGLDPAERAAWAFAAGVLATAGLYLCGIAAHADPGPKKLLGGEIALALLLGLLPRAAGARRPAGRRDLVVLALLALSAAAVAVFLLEAVSEPMWSTDYLAVWGFKAKTIFFTGAIPSRLFRDPATAWSHPEYPLLLPASLAAFSAAAGRWNDQALAILYPAFQAATVAAVFGFLRRRASARAAAVCAFLVAAFFPLYRAFHVGMAEIPLALGLVLAACAFFDLMEEASGPACVRAATASLLCAGMKQEGTLFVLFLAALFAAGRARRHRPWAPGLAALALPALTHGLLLRLARGPLFDRDFDPGLLAPARLGELLARLGPTVSHLFGHEIAPRVVPLAALAVFFAVTRASRLDAVLPALGLQGAVYVLSFALCAYGPAWLIDTSAARLFGALFPVLARAIGGRLAGPPGPEWGRVRAE
jgi:hypothetical protein